MEQSKAYRELLLTVKGHPEKVEPLKLKFLKKRMIRYAKLRKEGGIPEYKHFIPKELTKY